nr:hypothetical protein [Tanacetum cinerariifolium]
GCSISSLVRGADVHGPYDMLPDLNIRSFPRPGRERCDIGDELSHHTILDTPNIIGDDVSIDNSQTPQGPNALKHRPVNPSHREEIWVIDTEHVYTFVHCNTIMNYEIYTKLFPLCRFVDNPGVVRSISSMLKSSFHGLWNAWTDVDQDSRDRLWTRFKIQHNLEHHTSKLMLMGDDGKPLKLLNLDGQSTAIESFTYFSDAFGTHNASTKVATTGPNDIPSNKGDDGKKAINFRTLIAPATNVAHVAISIKLVLEVKERFENSVYGVFQGKRVVSNTSMEAMLENGLWLICNVSLIPRKWSPMANVSKGDLKSVPVWVKLHDTQRHDVRGLPICPKSCVVYKPIHPMIVKKSDTRQAKPTNTNSINVGNNNLVTSNLFDVLNMVKNDVGAAPSDTVSSKGDMADVNVGNNKNVNLDNEDSDTDMIEDTNETTSFMAPKLPMVATFFYGWR